MRILVIGDPPGDLKKIQKIPLKKADLILLTGDLGKADLARKRAFKNIERKKEGLPKLKKDKKLDKKITDEINKSTIKILKHLSKYAPVYTIEGNVGVPNLKRFGKKVSLAKNRLKVVNGIRIGFLEYFIDNCWIKEFGSKDKVKIRKAKRETEKARRVLRNFGKLDILVCHQPPYGFLDKVKFKAAPKHWHGKHAGSKTILDYIKRKQPKYVFCGHIHEGEGKKKIGKTEVYNLGVAGHKIVEF